MIYQNETLMTFKRRKDEWLMAEELMVYRGFYGLFILFDSYVLYDVVVIILVDQLPSAALDWVSLCHVASYPCWRVHFRLSSCTIPRYHCTSNSYISS